MLTRTISAEALRAVRRMFFAGVTLALLAACGKDNPTAPTPAHALRLTNNSLRVIEKVFVSPCTSPSWGDNQLMSPLAPMGVKLFPVSASGCYDVRVVAADGHSWRRDDITVVGTKGVAVE